AGCAAAQGRPHQAADRADRGQRRPERCTGAVQPFAPGFGLGRPRARVRGLEHDPEIACPSACSGEVDTGSPPKNMRPLRRLENVTIPKERDVLYVRMRTSIRRFLALPSSVSLAATGRVSPTPIAVMRSAATPCWTRKAATASARCCESARLACGLPIESV